MGIVVAAGTPAAAQPAPLVVDGDQIVYDQSTQTVEAEGNVRLRYRGIRLSADRVVFDLAREQLTAEGRVVLIDAAGRELRGQRLTYDVRLQLAEVQRAQTIVDRIYVQSEHLRAEPSRILGTDTMVTPCDPARPAVRVTARQIEIIPGDRLTARRASLWVGRYRVLTLPVLTMSLRSSEETARSLPRIGYNTTDGLWTDYSYAYDPGSLPSALYVKYGTRTGVIVRHVTSYQRSPFALELTVGRNQDADMRIFDQAEAVLGMSEQRIGSLPLFGGASLRLGWFSEATTGVRASRMQYRLGLSTPSLALGPRMIVQAAASWTEAAYGTGDRQAVWRAGLSLTHELGPREWLGFTYTLLDVYGATPFAFDTIATEDRDHEARLLYHRTGERGPASTALSTGLAHNFRDATTSVVLGYGERVPTRYHWGATAEYNLVTSDTKLTVDVGAALGYGTYATVSAIYHTLTRVYEDLDFTVTSRLCGCVDISLRYRHVRKEIWLEVGLSAFPETRLQFQSPPP